MVVACQLLGVKVKRIAVFFGKPVFIFKTRFGLVLIGYIPAGGYIRIDTNKFSKKSLLVRCLVNLAGPAAILFTAFICLGIPQTMASFLSAYSQFAGIILSPLLYGKGFIGGYLAHAQSAPITGFGILAAKNVALSLLPMPGLAGGRLLIELTEKRDESRLAKLFTTVGSLVAVGVVIYMAVVTISYFFGHR
jgi:regulator of sigma E protease